ncbi:MAG: short-chain dehydrogenase [Betaproteobacteria bacterium SG8_39]|nr:MAG: short-chain dehydrogenase [Betaproteobacteria bacterium SG8_39]
MKLADKVCVVTGGGRGIGQALATRFAAEGARAVVVADLALPQDQGIACDVSKEEEVARLVETVIARHGRIDLFCSNAGIIERSGLDAPLEAWRRTMDVNFMAHLYAARAVIPHMLAQGGGYLLQTASAAGLLMQVDSATYTVSKHAAVAFAEWLSVNYHELGIRVSCLCPQGVRTPMLLGPSGDRKSFLLEGAVSAEAVAECCVKAIESETFLVLPHPEVADYERRKTTDRDRWLGGMRRMKAKIDADPSLQGRD